MESRKTYYDLTHAQRRIWFTEKIYNNTVMHNISGMKIIHGNIDFSVLEQAINEVIEKNEALRLRFVLVKDEIQQYVANYSAQSIEQYDFSQFDNPKQKLFEWANEKSQQGFDTTKDRLYYFAMFRINDNTTGYYVKCHHIILDGWSLNILNKEINSAYASIKAGTISPGDFPSYREYIEQENQYLTSVQYEKDREYWIEKFNEAFEKGTIGQSHSDFQCKGNRLTKDFNQEEGIAIKKIIKENNISMNIYFVSATLIYMYLVNGTKDMTLGIPIYNRLGRQMKSTVGMFTSTMPFKMQINEKWDIKTLFENVKKEMWNHFKHQRYPYDVLLREVGKHLTNKDGLFELTVNCYNMDFREEIDCMPVEHQEIYNGHQAYPLQMIVRDLQECDQISLDFDYKVSDYSSNKMEEMSKGIVNVVKYMMKHIEQKIEDISFINSEDEKYLTIDFNQTNAYYPKEKSIYQLFEEQVKKTPQRPALVFNEKILTYKELYQRVDALASHIMARRTQIEEKVCIMTSHSFEMIVAILATLKAGCMYVPLDYKYPVQRLNYIIEDTQCKILLTNVEIPEQLIFNGEIFDLNRKELYQKEEIQPKEYFPNSGLAYIIYTSGSTGKPKGVMVEQKGLVNYIWWAKNKYIKDENDVVALYSSLSFDLTVTSIFMPLINGNKVAIYEDDGTEFILHKILADNKATIIKLTPAHLSLLIDKYYHMSKVRCFIVGGEDLKTSLASEVVTHFGNNIEIYNEYGPTETVVGCMIHKYKPEQDKNASVPIGVPISNTQIYLLDQNLNQVPINESGEIYISGDGVARGYINNDVMTKERFIQNPFIKGNRMYKTGDLARHLKSGVIEYLGRADFQVKIRGYRVELSEIENHLIEIESVEQAVVLVREWKNGSKYLCAYLQSNSNLSLQLVKNKLASQLPGYMVPEKYIILQEFPITLNGKIDRKQLLNYEDNEVSEISDTIIEPRTEIERVLVNTLRSLLDNQCIGLKSNFYLVGGDSIRAIQLATRLNDQGYKITVKDILSNLEIEQMAKCIESVTQSDEIGDAYSEGELMWTPIISWFFRQKEIQNKNYWNQSLLLKLEDGITISELEDVYNELIRHHDILRLNYDKEKNKLYYNLKYLTSRNEVDTYTMHIDNDELLDECLYKVCEKFKEKMDIENEIGFRWLAIEVNEKERYLLMSAHHLLVDGVSWRIIFEDILTTLKGLRAGQKVIPYKKTTSYQTWAQYLAEYKVKELESKIDYWKDIELECVRCMEKLPRDIRGNGMSKGLSSRMTQSVTTQILGEANQTYQTEAYELILIALVQTINHEIHHEKVAIEIEEHGRNNG